MQPIVNVPEKDRAKAIGNIHKKLGKDRTLGSGDILSDRHTDRNTDRQTYSSQYFAISNKKIPKLRTQTDRHLFNDLFSSQSG